MTYIEVAKILADAKYAEDVFTSANYEDLYRDYLIVIHPDRNNQSVESVHLSQKLGELYQSAKVKINSNTFGILGTIKNKDKTYNLNKEFHANSLANFYVAESNGTKNICQIYRNSNAAIAKNNYDRLTDIHQSHVKALKIVNHIVVAHDSFNLVSKQNVVILEDISNFHSLEKVKSIYSDGVELKHAAWMFNRLLASLIATHQAGYVNGSITPDNFFIDAETHNGKLLDFSYSVKPNSIMTAINGKYKDLYPKEIFEKKSVTFGLDIYMAANCLEYLLGIQNIPVNISSFIRYCKLGLATRPQDTLSLHTEFQQILETIFGEPKFHQFNMEK